MFRIDEGGGGHTSLVVRGCRHTGTSSVCTYDENVDVIQDTCRSHVRLIIDSHILPT
jgi:hypothetical protein